MSSVYHPGELAAQAKAGVRDEAERLGGIVRTAVPPAAAEFLAQQRILVLSADDAAGSMWATLLTGRHGFLRAESGTVWVDARPAPSDPLAASLAGHTQVGALAIDPATRRRMRVNGPVDAVESGLRITVEQAYPNCPKYIQRREPIRESAVPAPVGAEELAGLDAAALRMIHTADTFFVGTTAADGRCDASHRGGNPGFVHVEPDGTVSWPDYPGNAMMMTLGNLEQNPAAGLLFFEWATGTTLQLTGRAEVDWAARQRAVRYRVERAWRTGLASPLRWGAPEYSRFNPD
jgi:hypothetical protein